MEVEYVYLLSDWFRKPEYRDVLDYIISVNCRYYFRVYSVANFWLTNIKFIKAYYVAKRMCNPHI